MGARARRAGRVAQARLKRRYRPLRPASLGAETPDETVHGISAFHRGARPARIRAAYCWARFVEMQGAFAAMEVERIGDFAIRVMTAT